MPFAKLKSQIEFSSRFSKIYHTGGEFRTEKYMLRPKVKGEDIEFNLPYISPTMSYNKYSVQGFLKKRVNEIKFLQTSQKYKRYFTLDHNSKKMRVHKSNHPSSDYKMYEYKEVLALYLQVPNL